MFIDFFLLAVVAASTYGKLCLATKVDTFMNWVDRCKCGVVEVGIPRKQRLVRMLLKETWE